MRTQHLFSVLCVVAASTAQTDFIGSLLSVAGSVVASVLEPQTSSRSSSSTLSTTSSTSSSSQSSTSSTVTSLSTTASTSATASSSPIPSRSAAATLASASASATAAVASSSGNRDVASSNLLAIVLGCTLGALALAAFLALLFFCRRRRQRSRDFAKHRPVPGDDGEGTTWHHEKPRVRSVKEPMSNVEALSEGAAGAPLMFEQRASNVQTPHHNPFVPVPPPARKVTRHGLHDGTTYSAHPYSPDDVHAYGHDSGSDAHHSHSNNHALAAGVGGAVLGGAAIHAKDRHDRKRSTSRGRKFNHMNGDTAINGHQHDALHESNIVSRRSGSVGRASVKEPWPFMDGQTRKSTDSGRSDGKRHRGSQDYFSTPDQHPADVTHPSVGPSSVGAAAVGGLAGIAAGRKSKSQSPHRKGILKQTTSDSSDPSSISSIHSRTLKRPTEVVTDSAYSGPHELGAADVPYAPVVRHRSNSALGSAAPLSAAAAYRHDRNGDNLSTSSAPAPLIVTKQFNPPVVPSRSPKRTSLDYSRARYASGHEGTAELSSEVGQHAVVSPSLETARATESDNLLSPISPLSRSQSGSWSKAHAEQLGSLPIQSTSSQESTVVDRNTRDSDSSGNEVQSSGLVSAIQRIFNSGSGSVDGGKAAVEPSFREELRNDREKRLRNVPQRKPAPDRLSQQHQSQYGDITDQPTDNMPGSWAQEPTRVRTSVESGQSLPPQYRSRGNSFNSTQVNDFAPSTSRTDRARSQSRPGYGIGSGDPFDLARVRTDSSMTGISLANYQESAPVAPRPSSHRKSSASDSREPTLADLRREVLAEDRERAKKAWRNSHSETRANSASMRYGDDRELYDLLDQTTGAGRHEPTNDTERFYAATEGRRGSQGGHVGRAY